MGVVEEVKSRIDIVEVVGRYVQLQKAGRNFKAVCPFHNEKTPSFFVFPERQSWHCFGACNTGGDAITFVMKKENMTFGEALHFLADKVGVIMPVHIEPGPGRDEKDRLYQANEVASQFFNNLLINSSAAEKVREYLTRRGLNSKSISDFQIGYSPNAWEMLKQYLAERGFTEKEMLDSGLVISGDDGKTHDRFRHRLMFPIHDQRGHVTGFGGRALEDAQQPKYLNSPQTPVFDKSDTLYGIHLATPVIKQEDLAIITEGYMDVIIPHQYGFRNVVASMGVAITEKQVTKLKRLTKNLILALDPDTAGEEAMLRCIDYENTLGAEIKVIIVPEGKDPDEIIIENPDIWKTLVQSAKPVIEFAIEKTVSGLNMSDAGGRSKAASTLMPVIARVTDSIRREYYLSRLSKLTRIRYNQLEEVLKTYLISAKTSKKKPVIKIDAKPLSSSLEENFLTLLVHFPELKSQCPDSLAEYFQDGECKEICNAVMSTDDAISLRERLDPVILAKLEEMLKIEPSSTRLSDRFTRSLLMLRQSYLRNLELIRTEIFTMDAETSGHKAALERLEQEGVEPSKKLHEIHLQRSQMRRRTTK